MVVTYAHTDQNIMLPRLTCGSQRRHLALAIRDGDFNTPVHKDVKFDFDLYAPVDMCDACPPYGAPAISCDQHGYIYGREEFDKFELTFGKKSQALQPDSNIDWVEPEDPSYEYPMYYDLFDYSDYYDFDYLDDYLDELVTAEQEVEDFVDDYLHNDAPTKLEPWQRENERYFDAKNKRAYRTAISRSDSHRRRDSSVAARGRHGAVSRSYEPGVTPRRAYVAKKEAAI
jgi:hypothetical protein